ncbi:hypothetical protein PF005_g5151 [Phytophthora fragariae]|uniref:Uncharacterized protein n=1 Tax=Phytophthora fragariae TaxID=53985 RepID=A0A6A3LU79_9STRA|nr:hypothetical protein PF009_g4231 [Phytophthora fragariae]KAE9022819.1 hypothetical protein PF011_g4279 [Phytophthora fragariae]KAE9128212.1 hypothetical protein PF007_g5338 [Phytophthora fragariae]KAE9151410.1 hypothetical protein PF006_g4293 [Phytophthora fragariae]KAE9226364.1 hypothetical protein PF005_g5151 [Phytophthora fragariae]
MVDSSKHLLDNVDNVRLHHDLHTSGRPLRHRRGHYAQLDPMQMKDVCAMYKGGQANKKNLIIFGYVETELSLRQFLEDRGHEFVVTSKTTRSSPSSCTTAALSSRSPFGWPTSRSSASPWSPSSSWPSRQASGRTT